MVDASLNPKHRSRTKNENPLLQHTKARGFLPSASSLGRGSISDGKCFDKICPDDSAIIRAYFPTRRWVDAHWGFLRRVDDAYAGNECKSKEKAVRLATNRTACCAHDCSARFALQGVRRSRPRWELFGLIILLRFVGELSCPITFCSRTGRRSLLFLSKS